jgi:hypothetical protein
LAVFAAALNAFAVGAPLAPGFRILSSEPAFMRFRFAWMLAYKPSLATLLALLVLLSAGHYLLLDLVPEHFHRFLDSLRGEFGSFAAFGWLFI